MLFTSPWSRTPSAITPIVRTAITPESRPTAPTVAWRVETNAATAATTPAISAIWVARDPGSARPDVHAATTRAAVAIRTRMPVAQPPSGAIAANANSAPTSSSTIAEAVARVQAPRAGAHAPRAGALHERSRRQSGLGAVRVGLG